MAQNSMSRYTVYFVEYMSLGEKSHHSLYVETNDLQKTGHLYHVIGNLLQRMDLEIKRDVKSPDGSPSLERITPIACLRDKDLGLFEDVCHSTPPPKPQLRVNGKRIYPQEPLRTCQEWVTDVVEALFAASWCYIT